VGAYPLARSWRNPGTVTIPQYRFNKTKQHTRTSGLVQVDRPLVLVPLVSRRSEDPPLFVPLVPLRSENPLLLVPLVPRIPTCPNLSHLVVPLVLQESQLSRVRFFLGFLLTFHFSKNTFEWKFFIKYYHVGESTNNNKIFMKRQETTVTIHSNTWEYFV